jgi:uncharacterized membrane protein YtjA (UPF0391 family)
MVNVQMRFAHQGQRSTNCLRPESLLQRHFSGRSKFSGLRRPAERWAKIRSRPGRPPAEQNDGAEPGGDNAPSRPGGEKMLYYALVFFIIAVIAGLLGFGVIASAAAGIAKILFFVFLVLFIVTLIGHASRGRTV